MKEKKKTGEICLKHNNKKIKFSDFKRISIFSLGLILKKKKNAKALLFTFKKPVKLKITSFFVFFKFYAVFLDDKMNIVDLFLVPPWRFSLGPKKNYVFLLEIPVNSKYSRVNKQLDEVLEKFKKN